MQQRAFSSGSRQAPDPYDQYLEQRGFYRKHTARDASSLFRVISEQMYDSQLHHLAIRKKCVNYMRKHRNFFQNLIDRDLDEYLDDMSKPKTFASLIELQAVGLLYKRNVVLFEPYNLGSYFDCYRIHFNEVFRVFCSPERHFDSVFTSSYIKDVAICQSLCYELLYKDLFKLPDVQYAVEIMLHNANVEPEQCGEETNEDGYQIRIDLDDKRSFTLDLPNNTKCILENSKLCRFHESACNEEPKEEDKVDEKALVKSTLDSLLLNNHISCVRQLLMEGITPFPYKVAKALDPTMYRNIEFDSWNEARKELKLQNWYCGDGNFKVGAKCHVKLSKNDVHYIGHIQEISIDRTHCIVFIEQLGEKRLVPYDALSPLPVEQFKPWALPYRVHRQLEKYNSMRLSRHYNYNFKAQQASMHNYCKTFRSITASQGMGGRGHHHQQHFQKSCIYNLTHLENFQAHTLKYITMPLTVEHNFNLKYTQDANNVNNNNHVQDANLDGDTSTATLTAHNTELGEESLQVTSTMDNAAGTVVIANQDDSTGSQEVAIINQNYIINEQSGAAYYPEFAYYAVPPCVGNPEDYYAYGYETTGLHPQYANCGGNIGGGGSGGGGNGMYYMCNPTGAATAYSPLANNFYGQTQTTLQAAPQSLIISPTPMATAPQQPQYYCTTTSPYYASPMPNAVMPSLLMQAASSHTIQENGNNNSAMDIATPISGRINYEAKKSFKLNGIDLPTDVPTLRYFYNLGIDAHNRRRYSHDSSIGNREAITIKEERTSGAKDNNSNKADDNNNISNNSKSNAGNVNSTSHQNNSNNNNSNNKSQYGPPRRYQMRYNNNNNNTRDHRQTSRRNLDDAGNTGVNSGGGGSYTNSNNSYGHRNYNDYNKNNKHQNQHGGNNTGGGGGGGNERHYDSNRSPNTSSYNGSNYRMQYSRSYGRNSYYDNSGHNVGGGPNANSGAGDSAYEAREINNTHDHAENAQMYTPYGQPPPKQNYDHANDYNNAATTLTAATTIGAASATTPGSNVIIPFHVQQSPAAAAYGTTVYATTTAPAHFLQPLSHPNNTAANTFGNNPNYATAAALPPPPPPLSSSTYFAHPPPPSQIMHGNFNATTAPAGYYTTSNPLSSNASESSNGDLNISQPLPVAGTIPIYVAPNGVTNPTNGQPIMHQTSLPPQPPNGAPPLISGGPQGFWCMPPPPAPNGAPNLMSNGTPTHMPPPLPGASFTGPISTTTTNGNMQNRKSQQQQQQQTHTNDQEKTQ